MLEPSLEDEIRDGITAELSEEERYRLLADEQRRTVLDCLGDGPAIELERLARDVTARELGTDTPNESAVARTRVQLHHVHLPLLADLDVVEYDPGTHELTV